MLTVIGAHHTNPRLIPQLIDHTHQRTPTAPIHGLPRLLHQGSPHPAMSQAPITCFPLPLSLPHTPFQTPAIQHISTQSRSMHTAYHPPHQFQNPSGFNNNNNNNNNNIHSYPLATTPFSDSSPIFNKFSTQKSEKCVMSSPKTSKSSKYDENSIESINATHNITNNSVQITRKAYDFCVDAKYAIGKNDFTESNENNVYCHHGNSCRQICRKSQLNNNDIESTGCCTAQKTMSQERPFKNNSELFDVTSITSQDDPRIPKDLDQMGNSQTLMNNISTHTTLEVKQELVFYDKTKRSDCSDIISATSNGKQFIKNTNSEDFEASRKRKMFGQEISGDIEVNCKTLINTKQRQENEVKRVKKLRHSIAAILDMKILSGKEENESQNIEIVRDHGDASPFLNIPGRGTEGEVDGRDCKLSQDSYQIDSFNKSMTPDEDDSSNKSQHYYNTIDNSNFGREMNREENLTKSVQAGICNTHTTVPFQCFPDSVPGKEKQNNEDDSVDIMDDPDFEEIEVDDDSTDYNNVTESNINSVNSSQSLLSLQYEASTTIHSDDEVDAYSDSSSVGSFNKTTDIHESGEDDLSHLKKLEDLVVKNQTDHFKRDEFFNAREQILQCPEFQIRETLGEKIDRECDGARLIANNDNRCCGLSECFPSDFKQDKNILCCSENSKTRSLRQYNIHSHTHLLQTSSKEQLHQKHQQKQNFDHTLEMSVPSHNTPPKQFKLRLDPNNTCQKDTMFQQERDQNLRGSYNHHKQKQQDHETSPQRSDKTNKSAFKPISKTSSLPIPQPQFNRLPFPPHTIDPTLLSPRQQATMNDAFHLNTIPKARHPNTHIDNSHENNLLQLQPLLNASQSQLDAISLLRDHTSIHLPHQNQLTMFNNAAMLPTILKKQSPSAMNTWLNLVHQQYYPTPILKSNIIAHGSLPACSQVQAVASSKKISHSNVAPRYHCESCSKTYSTFGGLSKHKQFHCLQHVKKDFGCKFCTKSYSSLGALKMHIRTHTLPCKCHVCGKAFSRPWLLQGHVRTHTGEKPFQCNQCGRSFADRSNLRAHLQTHAEIKKYACVKCGKTFSRMSLLNKHSDGSCPANVMTCI